jgi:hypothetical protein
VWEVGHAFTSPLAVGAVVTVGCGGVTRS